MSNVLQGAVLECENLEDELAFWIQGLKMKVRVYDVCQCVF